MWFCTFQPNPYVTHYFCYRPAYDIDLKYSKWSIQDSYWTPMSPCTSTQSYFWLKTFWISVLTWLLKKQTFFYTIYSYIKSLCPHVLLNNVTYITSGVNLLAHIRSYKLQTFFFLSFFPEVQQRASSAMTWLSSNGGKVRAKDTVAGLSQLGAKGKYPANVERDTHRMLRRTGQWLGAAIDHVPVRMVNGEPIYLGGKLGETASHTPSPVLPCFVETREGNLPAMPFRQIFWRWCEKLLEPHWGHMWLVGWSPGSSVAEQVEAYICGGLRRRGPLPTENSECGQVSVVAWTSELAYLNESMLRYFTITCWSEHRQSEHTYSDCMEHVVNSFEMLAGPKRRWPWSDASYLLSFTFVQGDLKWICEFTQTMAKKQLFARVVGLRQDWPRRICHTDKFQHWRRPVSSLWFFGCRHGTRPLCAVSGSRWP